MMKIGMPETNNEVQQQPRITVFGVGGAGGNAVNNMIRSNLKDVEFVNANTDAQALANNLAPRKVQLGSVLTRGLGAGARPDVGRAAAEEQMAEIQNYLQGANMVFITAGMGGGTGTGAAPVIARTAREAGILTVGVVTKPFHFEGAHRMRTAESGIAELQQYVDTLIVIPNQNLFRIANEKTTFADAFKMADDVLHAGVRGVTDLMVMPGLINLDFADIRNVMSEMGKAMMGTGEAAGERRALEAAEAAISNPLLDEVSLKGARAMLINITGGMDIALFEVDEAVNRIRDEVDPDANIIFGSTFDPNMEGKMRVSVVATGIEQQPAALPRTSAVAAQPVATAEAPQQPAVAAGPYGAPRVEPRANAATPADYHGRLVASPSHAANNPHEAPVQAQQQHIAQNETEQHASMPQAERANGQFIAPAPVDAGPRLQPTLMADPSGWTGRDAAAPVEEAKKAARPSLFARMTGLGQAAKRLMEAGQENNAPVVAAEAPQQPAAPRLDVAPIAPTLASTPAAANAPERAKLNPADEDMLDIPAFLRRQGN